MKKCKKCKSNLKSEVFPKYEDKLLGIPGVYILNTVVREFCPKCPKTQSIIIPNLEGLIPAVAVARIKHPLKMTPKEIRFLRKAMEFTARKLCEKLQVRAETISRWENGLETMSPQSEKILRIIVADELAEKAPGIKLDRKALAQMRIEPISRTRLVVNLFAEPPSREDENEIWNEGRKAAANG